MSTDNSNSTPSKKHILLIDDEPINLAIAENTLQMLGFATTTAESGTQALQHYQQGMHFDLILMDCVMPEMSGFETTAALRANGVTTPIIALTAHDTMQIRNQALRSGMNDLLTKPFSMKKASETILRHLKNTND